MKRMRTAIAVVGRHDNDGVQNAMQTKIQGPNNSARVNHCVLPIPLLPMAVSFAIVYHTAFCVQR